MENFADDNGGVEQNEQHLARLRYEAGLMDGSLRLEADLSGFAVVCANDLHIEEYWQRKVGGDIAQKHWGIFTRTRILRFIEENLDVISHTIFLKRNFELFYWCVKSFEEESDLAKRIKVLEFYNENRIEIPFSDEQIPIEYLVGYFDAGNGTFFYEKPSVVGRQGVLGIKLITKDSRLTNLLIKQFGGTIGKSRSLNPDTKDKSYYYNCWRLRGPSVVNLIYKYFLRFSKFRQGDIYNALNKFTASINKDKIQQKSKSKKKIKQKRF